MNVWVIMDDDEFVAVAVDEATAREHAEAQFTAQLEKGHYGKDAERRIQWVTGGQGPELHRYGASFGRPGWHSTGFWLAESELIGAGHGEEASEVLLPLSKLFTPYGEGLVRTWYQEARNEESRRRSRSAPRWRRLPVPDGGEDAGSVAMADADRGAEPATEG